MQQGMKPEQRVIVHDALVILVKLKYQTDFGTLRLLTIFVLN